MKENEISVDYKYFCNLCVAWMVHLRLKNTTYNDNNMHVVNHNLFYVNIQIILPLLEMVLLRLNLIQSIHWTVQH